MSIVAKEVQIVEYWLDFKSKFSKSKKWNKAEEANNLICFHAGAMAILKCVGAWHQIHDLDSAGARALANNIEENHDELWQFLKQSDPM